MDNINSNSPVKDKVHLYLEDNVKSILSNIKNKDEFKHVIDCTIKDLEDNKKYDKPYLGICVSIRSSAISYSNGKLYNNDDIERYKSILKVILKSICNCFNGNCYSAYYWGERDYDNRIDCLNYIKGLL